jgi:hypothetical protein
MYLEGKLTEMKGKLKWLEKHGCNQGDRPEYSFRKIN